MKERLNWVDALRGFTMISVVMVHVLTYGFKVNPEQSVLCVMRGAFTLPLFFFVSGFFLYRPLGAWTPEKTWNALKVRSLALVGGTIVFFTLYSLVLTKRNPLCWVANGNFEEYWYTFSLFQLFFYYLVLVWISKLVKTPVVMWIVLIGITGFYVVSVFDVGKYWCWWWLNKKTLVYFPYFVLGIVVRRYKNGFFKIMEKRETLTVLIIIFVASLILGWGDRNWEPLKAKYVVIGFRNILAKISGLLLVIYVFYTYREKFDADTRMMRIWRHIGKRTLDIYFLHYFLLPYLPWVGKYMQKRNTFLTELVCGLIVAAFVLAVALGISALLRRAPYLRRLVGEKGELKREMTPQAAS